MSLKSTFHSFYNLATKNIYRQRRESIPLLSVIERTFCTAGLLSAVLGTTALWLICKSPCCVGGVVQLQTIDGVLVTSKSKDAIKNVQLPLIRTVGFFAVAAKCRFSIPQNGPAQYVYNTTYVINTGGGVGGGLYVSVYKQ